MYYLNANIQRLVFTYASLYPLNKCSIIAKDKKLIEGKQSVLHGYLNMKQKETEK